MTDKEVLAKLEQIAGRRDYTTVNALLLTVKLNPHIKDIADMIDLYEEGNLCWFRDKYKYLAFRYDENNYESIFDTSLPNKLDVTSPDNYDIGDYLIDSDCQATMLPSGVIAYVIL